MFWPLLAALPALRLAPAPAWTLPRPAVSVQRLTMSAVDSVGAAPNVTAAAAALRDSLAEEQSVSGLDERLFTLNKLLINTMKGAIDVIYRDNDMPRFYVLETVARVPYFAYLSVLHLRESMGERGLRERMRVHYAEADNELQHLLIMESLGGNASAVDRTLARTLAFAYYWYVVGVYALSEEAAYHLSELIEDHAYATYDDFLRRKGDELKAMPVPPVARAYYESDEPFLLDLVTQTCRTDRPEPAPTYDGGCPRRPTLASLYDVFVCIRDDEKEHWESLCNLVQRGELAHEDDAPTRSTQPLPVPDGPALSTLAAACAGVAAGGTVLALLQ